MQLTGLTIQDNRHYTVGSMEQTTTSIEVFDGALVPTEEASERELVAAFLLSLKSPNTRKAYGRDLLDWGDWLGSRGLTLADARRVHVDAYTRQLTEVDKRAVSTVARKLSAISSFYTYAVQQEVLVRSPTSYVKRPKVDDDSQTTGLDRDQVRTMLAYARDRTASGKMTAKRDYALLSLLAYNGLRIGEALGARVEDLGAERGHRVLKITRKGGKKGLPPLAPITAAAIDDYLDGRTTGPLFATSTGKPLDEPATFRMIRRVALAAGLASAKDLSPHSLRHSFVTLSLDAGVALRDVQDAAGHADPRTTRRYDRARHNLDRHPTYALASFLSGEGS
jgi:integrase/recombinase XerD